MATRRLAGGGFGVDVRGFHDFAAAARKAAPMVSRGLSKSLTGAGEIVAEEARKLSAEHSQQIPPTIKVRRRVATVAVRAGSPTVALAVLYEEGNKRANPTSTTFRHPVFGNTNNWVQQPRYPFLRPAQKAKMPEVEGVVLKELDAAVEEAVHGR